MRAPFFSVLIDTYNYGEYIEEAVSSALAQDFPAEQREILVVDDGSTDDTQERLRKFGETIRYSRKANGGEASAFNFCFGARTGGPARVVAISDGGHVLPGVPARGAAEIAAGTGIAAISGRCLSHGTGDFRRAGCGGAGIPGEIPPAWRESVPGECGPNFAQPDRAQDGHARGAAR